METELSTAEEWYRRASYERDRGRLTEAAMAFRAALAADPNCLPAQFALALLLLDLGDIDGSAGLARQMSAVAPGSLETLWVEARLAMANANWDKARDILRTILSAPELNEVQSAEAYLLLGLALGELGDADGAFAAAAEGKALQRRFYLRQASSRESETDKLKRLTDWLDRSAESFQSRPLSHADMPAAAHVFLLGFPRSGTTLLEQVLAAHPGVRTLEEEPLLAAAYEAFLSSDAACRSLSRLDEEEAAAWADHYWRAVHERLPDVADKLFIDKQPGGTVDLPIIARLFPRAKILFAVRDPRDVVLSCFRQPFRVNAMTYTFTALEEAATCYDSCMRFAEVARRCLPLAWADVRHEDLIDNFNGELGRILKFLELPPHEAMIDFAAAANTRPIRTPSARQVRAGLNRRGVGRWRYFEKSLEPIFPVLAPWVERFGYVR